MKNLLLFCVCFALSYFSVIAEDNFQITVPTPIDYPLISTPRQAECVSGVNALQKTTYKVAGQANEYFPTQETQKTSKLSNTKALQVPHGWKLADSVGFETFIPAGIGYSVAIDTLTHTLFWHNPVSLIWDAYLAVKKAPKWLQPMLDYTLRQLSSEKQAIYANILNSTPNPYLDEVAYSIAYSAPEYLSSEYCNTAMFLDNAMALYEHDKDLKYVEIVDYGKSGVEGEEDYYSTVKYWRIDAAGNKYQVEVPKEIYYMDIVHPKITDEIPAYIDPTKVEYDNDGIHTANIANPPTGEFWRNFIYEFTELKPDNSGAYFPILKDSVSKCEVVWDDRDSNYTKEAILEITRWVNDVMDFTSETERPHQPIRIYKLHIGRCGEHEDLTIAASRASLIPCRGIEAMSSDHVWNEFWDTTWCQWEPVNNSFKNKLCYSDGWGKKFGTVFSHHSDGVLESVTDQYTRHTSTLSVYALDANNKPIDGAMILLCAKGIADQTGIYYDTYGFTDNKGRCTFIIDSGQSYYGRIFSAIGNMPEESNYVTKFRTSAISGKNYEVAVNVKGTMPALSYEDGENTVDSNFCYYLKVKYQASKQLIPWYNWWEDFVGITDNYTFDLRDSAAVNFFISNNENFYSNHVDFPFKVVYSDINATSGETVFCGRFGEPWRAFFNTTNMLNNASLVNASFELYVPSQINVGVKDSYVGTQNSYLQGNYPNPFSVGTTIQANIANKDRMSLVVYNSQGVAVRHIVSDIFEAGNYAFYWDGNDDAGNAVPSGVYVYQMKSSKNVATNKCVLIRQ